MDHLVWFGHSNEYFNYRHHELQSLRHLESDVSVSSHSEIFSSAESSLPYHIIKGTVSSELKSVISRAVLTKAVIEIWGQGETPEEVMRDMETRYPASKRAGYINAKTTFCYEVITYGRKSSFTEQRNLMDSFQPLFKGDEPASMKNPDVILCIIEMSTHTLGSSTLDGPRYFYGRQIAPQGRLCFQENPRLHYALSDRPVLGPTTLDNDLAFIMANYAQVKPGVSVLDPFCGTCGILITCAALGARVFGSDLDVRVLNGTQVTYSKGGQSRKDVHLNFEHYGLHAPELVAMDVSARMWRRLPLFDRIVTDTPYGIRACTKKVALREREVTERDGYAPKLAQNADVEENLLDVAVDTLVPGGLLVFLMHIDLIDLFTSEEVADLQANPQGKVCVQTRPADGKLSVYAPETARILPLLDESRARSLIPQREGLEYIASALQVLTAGTGRLLVKMQRKIV